MIFKIRSLILEFLSFFFNFYFFYTVIIGYIFLFLAKNTSKLQKLFKKQPKSSTCLIIFNILSKTNPLFNVDLFSRTFDMESPISGWNGFFFLLQKSKFHTEHVNNDCLGSN